MALAAHWRQPGPLVLSIFLLSLCHLALFLPTLPPSYSSRLFPMTLYKIVLFSVWQSHHHEEEKRALRGEIIVLNNHLMEAKITINKLREDNVSVHNCLVWYRLPQMWTFTVWGDILGCFQTSKLKIRYFGCERSLEVAAPTPSTVQIFKFRFVQALRQPTAQKVLDIWASVGHGRVHAQPPGTLGRLYRSAQATSGASEISGPGLCGAGGNYPMKCLLFLWSDFTDLTAGEPPGWVRFFSLWSAAGSITDKLKSILPILSDLGEQIGLRVLLGGGGDLVPAERAARRPAKNQSF